MSENEVVIKSGRKVAVGSEWWELRDANVPVHYIDMITEARGHNGVVYLSLGSAIIDANNTPIVDMATRVRMDLGTAQNLHQILGGLIRNMTSPVDKSAAN